MLLAGWIGAKMAWGNAGGTSGSSPTSTPQPTVDLITTWGAPPQPPFSTQPTCWSPEKKQIRGSHLRCHCVDSPFVGVRLRGRYYSGAEEHFTHEKAGIGMTAYDLSNNTGTSINPCLWAVGNASSFYSSYLYGNETLRMLAKHDETVPLFICESIVALSALLCGHVACKALHCGVPWRLYVLERTRLYGGFGSPRGHRRLGLEQCALAM